MQSSHQSRLGHSPSAHEHFKLKSVMYRQQMPAWCETRILIRSFSKTCQRGKIGMKNDIMQSPYQSDIQVNIVDGKDNNLIS